jgi:hypothetical protein
LETLSHLNAIILLLFARHPAAMILPRRFYVLFTFSCFALLSTYFFLNRNNIPLSIPSSLSSSWSDGLDSDAPAAPSPKLVNAEFPADDEYDDNGLKKAPPAQGVSPVKDHGEAQPSTLLDTSSTSTLQSLATTTPQPKPSSSHRPTGKTQNGPLRISVLESGGSHDEVTAALVHAFGLQDRAEISLYLLLQRYGIADIMKDFNLTAPIAESKSSFDFDRAHVIADGTPPQILVSATCELDLIRHSATFDALLAANKTFLFCVVHHADRWVQGELVDKIQPWVDTQMVHFLGLSSHTAHYLRTEAIQNWPYNATVVVNYLPPVFPVNIPDTKRTSQEPLTMAMQGDYDVARRNYSAIFDRLGDVVEVAKNRTSATAEPVSKDIKLHLLGHGDPPKIPSKMSSLVTLDQGLDYSKYYNMLSRTFSLLPGFATDEYLDRKASSSVPAALIAGTPLIASEEIVGAYAYLPMDAVWLQYKGESEMDTVARIVAWSDEEHALKKSNVRKASARIVQRNTELVAEWVKTALMKIERASWTT